MKMPSNIKTKLNICDCSQEYSARTTIINTEMKVRIWFNNEAVIEIVGCTLLNAMLLNCSPNLLDTVEDGSYRSHRTF